MEELFAWALDSLVTVTVLVILGLDIFFFSDEDDGDFFDSVGISDSVVFFEMGTFMNVIENGSDVV